MVVVLVVAVVVVDFDGAGALDRRQREPPDVERKRSQKPESGNE